MADSGGAPLRILDLTAANPAAREDPYPRLADLRAQCPLHRDEAGGAWLVTRMADARTIFADNTHAKNPDRAEPSAHAIRRRRATVPDGLAFPDDQRASMLELDGEEHARVRNPLVQALYARITRFEPECIRIVDAALDRLDGRTEFDLMHELAEPVPVACIGHILSVPPEPLATFRQWLDGIVQTFNPNRTPENVVALVAASNGLAHYIRARFTDPKLNPPDDLFGDMARAQMNGAPLTDTEITYNIRGLLIAGNVTTTDLIGNAVRLLLTHPVELAKLRADPALWPNAVEEALRYEAPVDFTWRIATHDEDLSGCPVHAGAALNVFIRSANRDEAAFANAHAFDVSRPRAGRHLSFGDERTSAPAHRSRAWKRSICSRGSSRGSRNCASRNPAPRHNGAACPGSADSKNYPSVLINAGAAGRYASSHLVPLLYRKRDPEQPRSIVVLPADPTPSSRRITAMSTTRNVFCAAVASLSLAACNTMDSWDPSQRNAAIGGALGAAAGAALSDDDLEGALIGGALGAAVGYYTGCQEQGGCFVGGERVADRSDLIYDNSAGRYYYVDRNTGRTYWDNGQPRS